MDLEVTPLHFLRDRADDPAAWTGRAERLREQLSTLEGAALRSMLGLLGDVERVRGALDEADEVLVEAVRLSIVADDVGREASNRIRLAVVHQYADRHEEALDELLNAEAVLDRQEGDKLRDFLHLARGKVYAEMRRWDDAEREFNVALELRAAGQDPRLIQGVTGALAALASVSSSVEPSPGQDAPQQPE